MYTVCSVTTLPFCSRTGVTKTNQATGGSDKWLKWQNVEFWRKKTSGSIQRLGHFGQRLPLSHPSTLHSIRRSYPCPSHCSHSPIQRCTHLVCDVDAGWLAVNYQSLPSMYLLHVTHIIIVIYITGDTYRLSYLASVVILTVGWR